MKVQDFLAKCTKALQFEIGLTQDGDYGEVTTDRSELYDIDVIVVATKKEPAETIKPLPPTKHEIMEDYLLAKKDAGKGEHDGVFSRYLSKLWKPVSGLLLTGIIGAGSAWCGHYVAVKKTEAKMEQGIVAGPAAARNWRKYGQGIDWKKNGIPQSALVQIEHEGKCDNDDNHVGWADGDCTAAELARAGATFPVWGGNQGNMVKRSMYSVREICAVRWPPGRTLPGPITKSENCSGKATAGESTR